MLYKNLWLNLWFFAVTTFAVVWIEIRYNLCTSRTISVTTFAVVWIEIFAPNPCIAFPFCHHLRGGVD